MWRSARAIRFPGPASASPCGRPRGSFDLATVHRHFRDGFILSCASPPLQSVSSSPGPSPPGNGHLPWGPFPLRGIVARRTGPASQAGPSRPRRFSRPRRILHPHAFAGLFHPAATSRVRSPRACPSHTAVRARRSPLPSCRCARAPPPGLSSVRRVRDRPQGVSPRSARSLPELPLLRVLLHAPWRRLRVPSVHDLVRLRGLVLDVSPARDLTCSCEPASPVRAFRPSGPPPRLREVQC